MARPKTTGRSYSHKMYMNTTGYPEAIGRPGDKDYDVYRKRPHSDDKKPYMDDEYPEMENYWTPYDPPNFVPPGIPDDPRIPPMNPNQPPDIEGGPDRPPGSAIFPGCLFGIPVGPTVIQRGETTYRGIAMDNPFVPNSLDRYLPDPLVRLYVNYGPVKILTSVRTINACMISMQMYCLVSAIALTEFDAEAYHLDGDYFPCQVVGVTESGGTCAWNFNVANCPAEVEFAWNEDDSAETIVDSGSAWIAVQGGIGQYEWEVSGTGYRLAYTKTSGRGNWLYASAEACGTATITVTDGCDTVAVGTVRNTSSGGWVQYNEVCGAALHDESWEWTYQMGYGTIIGEKTLGGHYQRHRHPYDVGVAGIYGDDEAACQEARNDCGPAYTSLCMPYPGTITLTGVSYSGTYVKCGSTKYYRSECVFVNDFYWAFQHMLLRNDASVQLLYKRWEC